MIKNNRGITVISLSIAVIIILIVTGMLVYSAKDSVYVKNLTSMQNDISNLRDKISLYYSQYGALPASTPYTNTSMLSRFPLGANDDLNGFLIIDLKALDGLTLNYGKDYEKYKDNNSIDQSELMDIYVINQKSHNIFYVQGVGVNENGTTKMYYTDYTEGDKEAVNIVEVETGVRPGLEIGDYVNYTYDSSSTYNLSQNTSGYTDGDVKITQTQGMKWRILNIHEDGTVDLISETPTDSGPHFGGYLGYNNGVLVINRICNKFYSNSALGVEARNINLEDIEYWLSEEGIEERDSFISGGGLQYGKSEKINGNVYPSLYAKENGSGIDTDTVKKDGIDTSENGYDSATKEGRAEASQSLTVTQTYYSFGSTTPKENFENSVIYDMIFGTGQEYWIASRYVNRRKQEDTALFGIYEVVNYAISGQDFTVSSGFNYMDNYQEVYLRPVVSIRPDIEITAVENADGTSEENMHKIVE